MSGDGSVSAWITGLKASEMEAARRLWERYFEKVVGTARKRLATTPRQMADEEDLALSVFDSLCRGAADGRFGDLSNRDELWWLLLAMTKRKAIDYTRREAAQKRNGNNGAGGSLVDSVTVSHPFSFHDLVREEPSPEFLLVLEEENARLMSLLRDDTLRQIAVWRIEGYTVEEIAERLTISKRSVERKLMLIRSTWSAELSVYLK